MIYWLVTAASLLATWLNIHKHRACFALWLATNAAWAVADYTHGLPQQATLHVVYFVLAAYGIYRWRPPASDMEKTG